MLALAVILVAALGLAACGRKGPLDPPPSAAIPPGPVASSAPPGLPGYSATPPAPGSPAETSAKTGFDARGNPVAPPGPNQPFILDPLLR
jgi:predicted small lipoprotein YifL